MPKKVVSAGILCLDITPVFKQSSQKSIQELFVPGKLIEMGQADIHAGGSVANSGFAFQYFGADVTLMGKIGDDHFGELLQNIISSDDLHDNLIVSHECGTSYSVVIAPPGIDRIFLHYPGADNSFGYADIDFEHVEKADLFHFGYPTIMERLYKNDGFELIQIFKQAKKHRVLTSLDMAAIDANSQAAQIDWRIILKELMPYVDFFVPSVEELCFLLDRERHSEWMQRSAGCDVTEILNLENDVKPLANQLIDWGAKVVLIKCGAAGMYLKTADEQCLSSMGSSYKSWANMDLFEKSYKAEKFASGTGAGDVSLAAFLLAAIEGYTPEKCLQLATGAGACCVTSYDALSGLMSFDDILKKIDSGWKKNESSI